MIEGAGSMKQAKHAKVATCDQEAWIQDRIATAIRMASALRKESIVRADSPSEEYGVSGIIEGAAREIIETLGMKPEFTNIRERL